MDYFDIRNLLEIIQNPLFRYGSDININYDHNYEKYFMGTQLPEFIPIPCKSNNIIRTINIITGHDIYYNTLLIINNEIERINPYYPHLMDNEIDNLIANLYPNYKYISPLNYCPLSPCYVLTTYYLYLRLNRNVISQSDFLNKLPENLSEIEKILNIFWDNLFSKNIYTFPYLIQNKNPEVNTSDKNGILMCHGDKYMFNTRLPPDVKWITVDTREDARPTIIASYKSFDDLKKLGLNNWDYVVNEHCPSYGSINEMKNFLLSARWLLKSGGKVIIRDYARPVPKNIRNYQTSNNRFIERMNYLSQIAQDNNYSSYESDGHDIILTV